jgi:hypothetical protein
VEYCIKFDNREMSVGLKREALLQGAKGKYMSFIDDDDDITDAYVEDLVATIRGNYPVMRLRGQIAPYTFTHSLAHSIDSKMAQGNVFVRPPNHLNPMMTDVAKLIHFQNATRGEDLDWTIRMAKAGFLTAEYQSNSDRIHYIYNMGTRTVDAGTLALQSKMTYDMMLKSVWVPATPPAPPHIRAPVLRLGTHGFVSR